jgi:predicted ATPase/class 3 adenylate cyclase/DNA-binding winged helix-turn-helix (wHTH) protein
MDFRILGPIEVLDEGHAVTLGGSKQRALLAFLLLHANETLTTDRLIEELWGERPPPTAAKNVQMHVSRLRKALATGAAGGLVVTRERGYELELAPEQLDCNRFEALLAEGRSELAAGHPERALTALESALSLWRGEPLADLAYEPFAQGEIARLEDLRVGAIEQLIEAKLALGRHAEVIAQLEALIDAHPYRERLRGQLMLALYRCDRQADALQAYQDARRALVEELGIEPGERLRELERAVLAQDPALAAPVGTGDADRAPLAPATEELPTGVVTFLLTDIEGSSGLWEADPDGMAAALELHDELIARTVDAHGGRLLKTKGEGDASVTVFRRASDAVAGAVELQETLSAATWPGELELRVRMALHTGEAHERAGDYFGPALNRAARLRALARGGSTVVSQATAEIVHDRLPPEVELLDLGRHELRGLTRPENLFELSSVAQAPPVADASLEMRKTVAVLFSSVVASTSEGRTLDPEALRRVMSRYLVDMRAVLERHGGTVESYPGDALMAVFGVPLLHEDDALRAVRAAAEMREALPALGDELERAFGVRVTARFGVGAGEVLACLPAAGRPLATGEAVNVAKRLEELAGEGEILIDEETHGLVRGRVRTQPAGRQASRSGESIAALRLVEVRPHTAPRASRLDSPLVGRQRQLETLSSQFAAAVNDRTCHLVTVLGGAGVGKSRLVEEFVGGLGDQGSVLRGRCLPYGEGITYWPLAEVVSDLTESHGSAEPSVPAIAAQLAGEPKADLVAAGVAEALGLGSTGATSEKIFWAARRLFEAVARRRPLVVVFDDLQWAEPTFLDLVEHLTELSRDAPMVVLCMARPELLDERPGWGGGKLNATSILLEPLSEGETIELITNLLSHATLPPEAAGRIAEATEGNPLFAEELLAMLIEDGLLRRADGSWTVADELAELPVPPTIHALLAARLEGLPDDERALLAHASVEGAVFHRGALDELVPDSLVPILERNLTSLVRRDMIRPDRASVGDDAYRFRHILIRDAAYRSLPKETRVHLHERYAAWGERISGPRLREFEEIIGYHLEQAYRLLGELGTLDADAEELAVRGAERLESAGRRALARSDHSGAVNLLERTVALLPDEHPRRLSLLPELGAALIEAGRLADADQVLAEASHEAATAGDGRACAYVLVQQQILRLRRGELEGTAEAAAVVERVLPVFEREDDDTGLCDALRLRAWLHWLFEAQAAAAAEAWEQAAAHARLAGAEHVRIEILGWVASSLLYGPTPVPEAIRRCDAIWSEVAGNLVALPHVLQPLAGLHAMEGRFDRARELLATSHAAIEELGFTLTSAAAHTAAGTVELLAGDPVAAEQSLRCGYTAFEETGERSLLSTTVALLAQALLAQGRDEEAERFAALSQELAAADDLVTQVLWRGVRARTLAGRGRVEEPERLAGEAVELAERSDFVNDRADAVFNLAIVQRHAGHLDEAQSALAEALRLYERKGNLVGADRVRAELAALTRL